MQDTQRLSLDTPSLEMFRRFGLIKEDDTAPAHIRLFAEQADRVLLRVGELVEEEQMNRHAAREFQQLILDSCATIICHPIIASNLYLQRFSQGVTLAQARHEIQQFSVFGLQFDVAQTKLVANAPTIEAYQERLKVLLNEKGIPFKDGFEGELADRWSMATVHFTWMQNTAQGLGLTFEDLGKIWIALPGTRAFVDATFDTYASTDQNKALGASFAIENWAANGLWTPWIAGMQKLCSRLERKVDLGYLTYHEAQEAHHSQATLDELLENFQQPWFDAQDFLFAAESILTEGVQAYYESQLENLPDKDETWPATATLPRAFDPLSVPRLAPRMPTAS